jgi:general secretion pathway protein J
MSVEGFSTPAARQDAQASPKRRDRARGFTLIEVVLALTIFALMGTILYGAFSLGHSAVEKSAASFSRNQKLRSVADLLGSYLRSAYPYRESPQELAVFFEGDAESLAFISAYSRGLGGRGMAKISIAKENAGGTSEALNLEETTPVRLGAEAGSGGQTYRVVLQTGIRDFRLAYLDPQSDEETWEERWNGNEKRSLPRAIRFTYLDDRGKEVRWTFPVMIAVLAQ